MKLSDSHNHSDNPPKFFPNLKNCNKLIPSRNARDPGSTPGRGNIFRNKFIIIFKIWEKFGGIIRMIV